MAKGSRHICGNPNAPLDYDEPKRPLKIQSDDGDGDDDDHGWHGNGDDGDDDCDDGDGDDDGDDPLQQTKSLTGHMGLKVTGALTHRLLGSNCVPMGRLVTHGNSQTAVAHRDRPRHGVAGIHAATHSPVQSWESQHPQPVAQPQQQQGVADIHAAITPTTKTAFTEFLESVKRPDTHWRNVLNNHNTKRPHGDFVNASIGDTIECRQVRGGWLATLDWPNSYRRGDGQPVQASSGVCESKNIAVSMVCREMFLKLLLRAPHDQELGEPWVRICDGPFIQGAVEQIRQRVRELREEVAGTLAATPGDAAPVAAPAQRPLAAPQAYPAPAK